MDIKQVIGINAPLEERPQQVLQRLKSHIKDENISSDILILVDMGSLTTFGEELQKEFGINTKTIPLVSTLHVIEAARKAMLGYSLEEVYIDTLNVNSFLQNESIRNQIENEIAPNLAILTICTTGEGSALTIKNFLEEQLEFDRGLLEIIPINLIDKESINTRIKKLIKDKNLVCIVSTFNVNFNVPQFGLYDVLNKSALITIQQLIDIETTYIKMGDTLKHQLKNVDGSEVFKDIRKIVSKVEEELNMKIDTDILIGVTLHMGCMVDRLKIGGAIIEFEESEQYVKDNLELYLIIKRACDYLNKKYNIKIIEDEICYIMSYLNTKSYS